MRVIRSFIRNTEEIRQQILTDEESPEVQNVSIY